MKVGEAATKYWGDGPTPANAAKFFAERDKIYDPANNPDRHDPHGSGRTRRCGALRAA